MTGKELFIPLSNGRTFSDTLKHVSYVNLALFVSSDGHFA